MEEEKRLAFEQIKKIACETKHIPGYVDNRNLLFAKSIGVLGSKAILVRI